MSGQLHDVKTASLVRELRRRGADVYFDDEGEVDGGFDFDHAAWCFRRGRLRDALWSLERALPASFAGLHDAVVRAAPPLA